MARTTKAKNDMQDESNQPVAASSSAGGAREPEELAQRFHEAYERLAPDFGYSTREASRKPWAEVPEQNRKLMIAVCAELLQADAARLRSAPAAEDQLRAAFDAGFAWCSSGTDKYGEYNGGSVEDGFTSWSGEPGSEARSAPVEAPKCKDGIHEWSNDYGDDWTPEVGTPCDCGKKQWGIAISSPGAAEPSKE